MKIKNILRAVLLMFIFDGYATATTAGPDVTFAGFAFLGDFTQKENLYPYTSRIALEEEPGKQGQSKLNHKLFNAARDEIRNPHINLSVEHADYKQGDTISLALITISLSYFAELSDRRLFQNFTALSHSSPFGA